MNQIKHLLKLKANPFINWKLKEEVLTNNVSILTLTEHSSNISNNFIITIFMKEPKRMLVTGDYGNWVWDKMTWEPSIYNIPFDNISLLSEKLSDESKQAYKEYNNLDCLQDIQNWFKSLFDRGLISKVKYSTRLWNVVRNKSNIYDIPDFCCKFNCEEYEDFFTLVQDLIYTTGDESDFIHFLNFHFDEFEEVEPDFYLSTLFQAGRHYSKRYLYTLLALETVYNKIRR